MFLLPRRVRTCDFTVIDLFYQLLFMLGWLGGSSKIFVEGLLCSLNLSRYVETIPYVYTFCLSFTISFISIAVFAC